MDIRQWKHIFKLDPERELDDESLERLCLSGTDAIVVGGTTGVTFDNTVELLSRIRRYELPCALEISNREAVVPGFDLYFIPVVLNAGDPDWIVGHHHAALKELGSLIPWERVIAEGYVVLNGRSAVAAVTRARTELDGPDIAAYARTAEKLFRLPVFYMEFSGTFGDMELVRRAAASLTEARLFYGGGIDGVEKARLAARAADTVVVGNIIYERLDSALETVQAVREQEEGRLFLP